MSKKDQEIVESEQNEDIGFEITELDDMMLEGATGGITDYNRCTNACWGEDLG